MLSRGTHKGLGVVGLECSTHGGLVVYRPLGLYDDVIRAPVYEGEPSTAAVQLQHLELLPIRTKVKLDNSQEARIINKDEKFCQVRATQNCTIALLACTIL